MGAEHDVRRRTSEDVGALATVAGNHRSLQDGQASCPEPVVDALIETAWAFPKVRVSCAQLTSSRQLRFLASAGAQPADALTDATFDIGSAPRVFRLLACGEIVTIEDLRRDSRIRVVPEVLEANAVASMLLLPIRSADSHQLLGAVCFDAARPRTWSSKEEAALDRIAPLTQLALHNLALRQSLDAADEHIAGLERRSGAIRGVLDSAIHDGRVLIDALINANRAEASTRVAETIRTLERQLFDVLGDVAALPDRISARRDRESVDLNELIVTAAPVLRAVLGPQVRLLARTDPLPVWINANRTGLDRLLRALVTHATSCGSGRDVVLRTYATPQGARIEIGGAAIGTDDRLLSIIAGQQTSSLADLGIDLWQVQCEALLNDGAIRYQASAEGTKIFIDLRTRA